MGRLLTLAQAGEELGMSGDTLRVQIRNRKLRATKYGTVWLVTEAEVARYGRESRGRQAGQGRGAGQGGPRPTPKAGRKERPKSDSLAQKSDRIAKVPRPKSDRTPKVPAGSHWIDPDGHGVYVSATDEPPDSDSRLPAMSHRFGIPRPAPKPGKKR